MYAVLFTLFPVLQHQEDSVVANGKVCYVKLSLTYMYIFVVINLFVPLAVIITLNLIIFRIANRHTEQIRSFHSTTGSITEATSHTGAAVTEHTAMVSKDHLFSFKETNNNGIEDEARRKSTGVSSVNSSLSSAEHEKGRDGLMTSSTALNRDNSINDNSCSYNNNSRNNHNNNSCRKSNNNSGRSRSRTGSILTLRCNIKAAKRIAMLVGECIFCWLFYIIVVLINISGKWKDPTWNPVLTKVAMMINCSTLFFNPLVYGLLNPKVRTVVMSTLKNMFNCGKLRNSSMYRNAR